MSNSVAYRAKWVLPITCDPIENGIVTIQNGLITSVERASRQTSAEKVIDLGDVALTPGWINAYTRLEHSQLELLPYHPDQGVAGWTRSAFERSNELTLENKAASISYGLEESAKFGVVGFGDILSSPWNLAPDRPAKSGVVFLEQFGNNPIEASGKAAEIQQHLLQDGKNELGVSPSSTIFTSLNLFDALLSIAQQSNSKVSISLASSLEEVEFAETGKGTFADMLGEMEIPFSRPGGAINMGDYLKALGKVHSIIAHGNYLNIDELEFAATLPKLSFAFCPRAHQHLNHPEYPLRTMLDLNLNVAIGTESGLCTSDMNLFSDMQLIALSQPSVTWQEIMSMATLNGAKAVGLEDQFGSIEIGKSAKLNVISKLDSLDQILSPNVECSSCHTFVAS